MPVFSEYQSLMTKYIKMNKVIGELKSEAMKQRHWKELL
jgi:dynein heavy chain 1